jgi:hypothetical protein
MDSPPSLALPCPILTPPCLLRAARLSIRIRYGLKIAFDAAGGLGQRLRELTKALLAQTQASFRSCASDIANHRLATTAVAWPFFSPMDMHHHKIASRTAEFVLMNPGSTP